MEHRPFIVLPRRGPLGLLFMAAVALCALSALQSLARMHWINAAERGLVGFTYWCFAWHVRELDRWRSAVTRSGIAVIEEAP